MGKERRLYINVSLNQRKENNPKLAN